MKDEGDRHRRAALTLEEAQKAVDAAKSKIEVQQAVLTQATQARKEADQDVAVATAVADSARAEAVAANTQSAYNEGVAAGVASVTRTFGDVHGATAGTCTGVAAVTNATGMSTGAVAGLIVGLFILLTMICVFVCLQILNCQRVPKVAAIATDLENMGSRYNLECCMPG